MRKPSIADAFDLHYAINAVGCYIWLRARKGKEAKRGGGYGCFRLLGRVIGAHKYAYERAYGPVPTGMQVSHKCHNTLCVNHLHMCLETNDENQARGAAALRRAKKLTPEIVRDIRDSCAAGVVQRVMAEKYGINQGDVSHIIKRRWWKHVA